MVRRPVIFFLILCASLLCLAGAEGAGKKETPVRMDPASRSSLSAALEDFDRAVAGSTEAVDKTISRLEQLLKHDPRHHLARAHLGNTYALQARHASLWSKRRWVERGFRELDAAVTRSGGEPQVRLVRAVNAYNLPRLLERRDVAQKDFRILLETVRKAPEAVTADFMKEVLFHAGAFALKENDAGAISLLEEAKAITTASPLDRRIETMLRLARNRFEG